jgi:hypothetical protein
MQAGEILAVAEKLPEGVHECMFHPRAAEKDPEVECLLELGARGLYSKQ